MRGLQFHPKTLTFSLLITILLLGSSFGLCSARRGRHWRHGASVSASLYKKKSKSHSSHGSGHHVSKKKGKAPLYIPPTPTPAPSPSPARITPLPPPSHDPYKDSPSNFNVLDFGAKGDAVSDDTMAFESAWAAACKVEASTMIVPSGYQFLVGPITFSGPYCMPNIVFQLDGEIIAPTSPKVWGSEPLWWIQVKNLKGFTIQGAGVIDGSGSVWWQNSPYDSPVDSESQLLIPLNNTVQEAPPMPVTSRLSQKMPSIKPTALRFYGSSNVTVTGITIQNSQQCHLKFDNCVGVTVHDMNVTSPSDSPNTDGIHLQNSQLITIHHTNIACGDDCISIQTGCSNVYVHNINCGPGHGISIGSLGKDKTKACVSNVTVRDVQMSNTMTGVRIKTWQGGSGSVKNIMFSNIVMTEVQLPIVIDQFYCDKSVCHNQSDAVSVSGVTYERIRVKETRNVKTRQSALFESINHAVSVNLLKERFNNGMVSSKLLKKSRAAAKGGPSQAVEGQGSKHAPPLVTEAARALAVVDPIEVPSEPGSPNPDLRSKRKHDMEDVPIGKRLRKDPGKGKGLMIPPKAGTGRKETAPSLAKEDAPELSSPGFYSVDAHAVLPDPLVRTLKGVSQEATALFSSKSPSSDDLRLTKPPSEYCLRERAWFDTLPMDLLHLETMRYMEMMRMGIAASWRYGLQLEEKCRRIEQGEGSEGALRKALEEKGIMEEKLKTATAKVGELTKSSKDFANTAKKKIAELEGKVDHGAKERAELESKHKATLAEKETALANAEEALAQAKREKEKFKREFTKSEEFQNEVVKNIGCHWEHGVRVGVRQAVAKYESLDPSIVLFTPDYDDSFGEPDIEDSDMEVDAPIEEDVDAETAVDDAPKDNQGTLEEKNGDADLSKDAQS